MASVTCPECGAEQTSPYGYAPAQTVRCRRCDATFRVAGAKRESVAADEDDPPPRSKSWLVAGAVLVLIGLGVVGVARYAEQQRERAEEEQLAAEMERERAEARAARGNRADLLKKFGPRDAPPPNLFDFARAPSPAQTKETTAALSKQLVGVWRTAAPEPPREVEYKADGSFRDGELSGTWKAVGVRGSKVLTLERSAGRSPLRVTFEGDELIHDGAEAGASVVLRR